MLTLLLEFFVLNAGGFLAFLMYDPETSARKRSLQVANARPPREERNVHSVADWRINLGVFVLLTALLLAIIGNQERVLAWLAGD